MSAIPKQFRKGHPFKALCVNAAPSRKVPPKKILLKSPAQFTSWQRERLRISKGGPHESRAIGIRKVCRRDRHTAADYGCKSEEVIDPQRGLSLTFFFEATRADTKPHTWCAPVKPELVLLSVPCWTPHSCPSFLKAVVDDTTPLDGPTIQKVLAWALRWLHVSSLTARTLRR